MFSTRSLKSIFAIVFAFMSIQTVTAGAEPPGAHPAKAPAPKQAAPAPAADVAKPAETLAAAATAPEPTTTTTPAAPAASAPDQGETADVGIAENAPEQGAVPLEDLDMGEPVVESGKKSPFFSDATLKLNLRSYYFSRDKYDDTDSEAVAIGGSLAFKSGYLAERFGMGAVLYTSQPIYAPDSRGGTGILEDDQDGYTILGQIYGEVKIVDGLQLNFGRKEYNTPFVNMHDVRMTPKTFQGVTLTGTHKGNKEGSNWRYGAGYLYKMKDWNDTSFSPTTQALGVDEDRGIGMLGGNYSTANLSIGAIDYFTVDCLNIFYTEGSYAWKTSPNTSIKLGAQIADQRSLGDDLITGDEFDVQQFGVKADFGVSLATFTVAFTETTAGGTDERSPWGGYPGFTSVQVKDFNRSGESAVMAKAALDFTKVGAPGFSTYLLFVHGFGRDVEGTFNEDEYDFNLQWAPKEGRMKDFSARLRYARINQRGGGDPSIDDFRIILNYTFGILPWRY